MSAVANNNSLFTFPEGAFVAGKLIVNDSRGSGGIDFTSSYGGAKTINVEKFSSLTITGGRYTVNPEAPTEDVTSVSDGGGVVFFDGTLEIKGGEFINNTLSHRHIVRQCF